MNDLLPIAVAVTCGYLVGSVPTAYLVARWMRGIDIRRYGSGNVGASNVGQHVGGAFFVLVAAFDAFVKGSGSVLLARVLGLDLPYQAVAALLAVVGHNWSAYLRFSGGRGLTVVTGALLVLAWKEAVASLAVFFLGWLVFRNGALWSGIAVVLLPLWALLLGGPPTIVLLCVALLVITAMKRLLANPGTGAPGFRWRDVALYRLLYDRDTLRESDWVDRKPEGADHKSNG